MSGDKICIFFNIYSINNGRMERLNILFDSLNFSLSNYLFKFILMEILTLLYLGMVGHFVDLSGVLRLMSDGALRPLF